MCFEDLARRILTEMRAEMKEIYQPAGIICLIYHGAEATLDDIHDALEGRRRERDPQAQPRTRSQTKVKPCQWLQREIIREVQEGSERYELRDFADYTPQQLTAIV